MKSNLPYLAGFIFAVISLFGVIFVGGISSGHTEEHSPEWAKPITNVTTVAGENIQKLCIDGIVYIAYARMLTVAQTPFGIPETCPEVKSGKP
jgi:hypothetical protein